MKITVTDIEKKPFEKEVRFKEALLKHRGDDFTTDVGTQAIRILRKLAGQNATYRLTDHTITITHGEQKHFSSQTTLQQQIDKFANNRLTLSFGEPIVKPLRSQHRLRTMQEVDAYYRAGYVDGYIVVRQIITLSLPVAGRDLLRVEMIKPGIDKVWALIEAMDCIGFQIMLKGKLDKADPWKVINSTHPKIKKLIV